MEMQIQTFVKGIMRDDIKLIPVQDIQTKKRKALGVFVTYDEEDNIIKINGESLGKDEGVDEAIRKVVENKGMEVLPGCWWFFQYILKGKYIVCECSECGKTETCFYEGSPPSLDYECCPFCGKEIKGFLEASLLV